MRLLPIVVLAGLPSLLAAQSPATARAAASAPPTGARRAAIVTRLDSLVRAVVAGQPLASASVAVVRGRDTLLLEAYGSADLEHRVPAMPASVYRIAGITKSFTAAAVMQQVEAGTIHLDDALTRYVPEYPVRGRHITVRQLLTHTSGIPDYTELGDAFDALGGNDIAQDSLVALFSRAPLLFEPGATTSYSNSGFYLLGIILERVTGQTYADYLRERVYPKAGLTATRYCDTRSLVPNRAQGYVRAGDTFVNAAPIGMTAAFSSGALCSTAADLVAWLRALRDGRVVSAAAYRTMAAGDAAKRPGSTTVDPTDSTARFGYGLVVGQLAGHRRIGHGGGINGFTAVVSDYPDDSLTVAVLVNTGRQAEAVELLARHLAEVTLALPLTSRPSTPSAMPPAAPQAAPLAQELALGAAERAQYVGRYRLRVRAAELRSSPTVSTVRVYEEIGRLMVQTPGSVPDRLVGLGGGRFVASADPGVEYTFTLGANGGTHTSALALRTHGITLAGAWLGAP
jgi:D-alanyl-D-alanine carboxypeptidase